MIDLKKYLPKRQPKLTLTQGHSWHVKVPDVEGFDLTFPTRKQADQYKQSLYRSHRKLHAYVVSHTFFDNFIVDEEVS